MPEVGDFYYHFKHHKNNITDHAYVITGFGMDLENDKKILLYKPLYDLVIDGEKVEIATRSIENFTEMVTRDGKTFTRFTKIIDKNIIAELKNICI